MTTRITQLSRSIGGMRAIVTGSASGIGRSTAHLLADEGARVVVADLGTDRVDGVVHEIREVHGDDAAIGVVCDVADHEQLRHMVATTVNVFDGIDIVINNAGVALPGSLFADEESFESNWARTIDVNLTAHARLARLALPHLQVSTSARVVNVASTEAIVTSAGMANYTAAKSGVVGLTKSMAVELGRHGVMVNCVCPGPILTGMTESIPDEAKQTYARRRVPLHRYGVPEEVAHVILSLCLPAASYVNGAIIPVDGGMSVRHT